MSVNPQVGADGGADSTLRQDRPPGPTQARVAETEQDAPGPQSKLFWKWCAATFRATNVPCINLERPWSGDSAISGLTAPSSQGGQTAPWARECSGHQPRMPLTVLGCPPRGPDEAPDTPGWALCLVTQPVERTSAWVGPQPRIPQPTLAVPLRCSPKHFETCRGSPVEDVSIGCRLTLNLLITVWARAGHLHF